MKTFQDIGIKKQIIQALYAINIKEPLEVQQKIIPLTLQGKNIVFTSQTGSGKTLAYALGFLGKIDNKRDLQMLIIVPTRELCIQVGKDLIKLGNILKINVGMLYGGRDLKGDFKTTMKKNQIIIGTPGRLIQHINDKKVRVGDVKYLVFDESDQMFDNGFYEECAYIKERVSKNAQILLASATISNKVQNFMEREIRDYEIQQVGIQIPKNIIQNKIFCEMTEKDNILLKLFGTNKYNKAIIFCNTKTKSYKIAEFLKENKIKTRSINSDFEQKERDNNLNMFKNETKMILVATDLAARGLHIEKVDVVVNYDVPTRQEFYIHRIGRTGRNDKDGSALTLICPEDEEKFKIIETVYELKCETIDINSL